MVQSAQTSERTIGEPARVDDPSAGSTGYVTLEAVGLTMLGVLINLGVMVAIAVHGAWFVHVVAGLAAPLALALLIKAAHARAGAMKHIADWLTH